MRIFIPVVISFYVALHALLYVKLIKLFRGRYSRLGAGLFFLFLACAFPLGEIWNSHSHSAFSGSYLLLGFYYLPFLLYFLLQLALFQIFVVSTRWFGMGIRQVVTGRIFQRRAMMLMTVISLAIVVWGHINFNSTRITRFQADIPARTSHMEKLKIAMAADFHISEFTSKKFMKQFVEKINALHPDIVLLPGDVLEGVGETSGLDFYEKKLSEIQSRYGVFACPGNHEHYGGKLEDTPFFKNAHITMLIDADTVIGNGFRLAGLDWQEHDSIKVTHMFLRMQADTIPKILMRHAPNDFETNRWISPDVQVSGHTHYGQLWPLNLIISSLYELPWGYQIIDNCHVFVTCGTQGWGPPVRTGSYSEIMEIDLSFVKENK